MVRFSCIWVDVSSTDSYSRSSVIFLISLLLLSAQIVVAPCDKGYLNVFEITAGFLIVLLSFATVLAAGANDGAGHEGIVTYAIAVFVATQAVFSMSALLFVGKSLHQVYKHLDDKADFFGALATT